MQIDLRIEVFVDCVLQSDKNDPTGNTIKQQVKSVAFSDMLEVRQRLVEVEFVDEDGGECRDEYKKALPEELGVEGEFGGRSFVGLGLFKRFNSWEGFESHGNDCVIKW